MYLHQPILHWSALRDAFSGDRVPNLTRTVSAPISSNSPLALVALREAFTDDPAATLTVNRFGNFTAYFKALPPAVPAQYIASLFTVVVTAIVGSLLIPSAISWSKSKKQISRLNSFHQQMAPVYADDKVDKTDTGKLNRLNKDISDSYAAGKMSSEQYIHLKNEVSTAYQEIFKKKIQSHTKQDTKELGNIKNDIKDAYSNGNITELHYKLLNEKISDILNNK